MGEVISGSDDKSIIFLLFVLLPYLSLVFYGFCKRSQSIKTANALKVAVVIN